MFHVESYLNLMGLTLPSKTYEKVTSSFPSNCSYNTPLCLSRVEEAGRVLTCY